MVLKEWVEIGVVVDRVSRDCQAMEIGMVCGF